jgi:hypothetical protein
MSQTACFARDADGGNPMHRDPTPRYFAALIAVVAAITALGVAIAGIVALLWFTAGVVLAAVNDWGHP